VPVVGVIANPLAGKDVRRLVTAASHTSDAAKIGIVRRVAIAAAELGARSVLLADDRHLLSARAVDGLGLDDVASVLDLPLTSTRADTSQAAAAFRAQGAGAVVVLGGDGTCRDVAIGWPDAPLVAISTWTNNVYPQALDGTAAGCAAGLVAAGEVPLAGVARRTKRLVVTGDGFTDIALVDVALIDTAFTGARAVTDPATVRAVVACVALPAATGLSAIAGRVCPVGRWEPGGVMVSLDATARRGVRVPIGPGSFATVGVSRVDRLDEGEGVTLTGPGVLAYDGERHRRLGAGMSVTVTVDGGGPWLLDVEATMAEAAARRCFDACSTTTSKERSDGQ